jgi:hypothetical protein
LPLFLFLLLLLLRHLHHAVLVLTNRRQKEDMVMKRAFVDKSETLETPIWPFLTTARTEGPQPPPPTRKTHGSPRSEVQELTKAGLGTSSS